MREVPGRGSGSLNCSKIVGSVGAVGTLYASRSGPGVTKACPDWPGSQECLECIVNLHFLSKFQIPTTRTLHNHPPLSLLFFPPTIVWLCTLFNSTLAIECQFVRLGLTTNTTHKALVYLLTFHQNTTGLPYSSPDQLAWTVPNDAHEFFNDHDLFLVIFFYGFAGSEGK